MIRKVIAMQNVRKDFPILNKVHNGHQIVYFDNAATTTETGPGHQRNRRFTGKP